MENWDVIIVGAGYGGLCSGALLAKSGKKVLVLEKDKSIGGRAKSLLYQGHILDDGAHMYSRVGHLEAIFSDLGIAFPEVAQVNNSEIYHEGAWKSPKEIFSADAYKMVFSKIMKLSNEEISALDDTPLNQWVKTVSDDPGIQKFIFYLGCTTSVGNRFETYSTGEMLYILKEIVEKGKLSELGGVVKGGMNGILQPLSDYIKSHGGDVRLNSPVDSVEIKNGQAVGVNIETGDKAFHSQILDIEMIHADYVIVTQPLWDIFSVIEEDKLPTWWVDWVNWIGGKVSQAWSIIYSIDEPLFALDTFRWAPDLPYSGFSGVFFPMPSYADEVNKYQFHVSYQGHWDELPDLFNTRKASVRRQAREFISMLEKESLELYPQLKSGYQWRIAHAGIYGIAQSPGLVGSKRPSMVPPGIDNMYIVSNTVREARGISLSATGKCARLASEAIVGKE